MKKISVIFLLALILSFLFVAFIPGKTTSSGDQYLIIGWNDLGMHCSNQDFSKMAILPPYNNQHAHVILKGTTTSMPHVLGHGSNLHVSYEIPGNTWSGSGTNTGKTNFWQFAYDLFGVNLPPDTGLTGIGISGYMSDSLNYFYAEGIPVTPYQDTNLLVYDPYQLTLLRAYDGSGNLLASTQTVIPVSNEINCVSSGCHTSEMDILNEHENVPGFNTGDLPILCADCHADNALGKPGSPGVPSFSQVIHQEHGSKTNDCYKCHPGPQTQCFRDVMHTEGMICQDCHGSVAEVGNSIDNGREPWLEEPSCGSATCHGPHYAEEPGKLFRQSHGHGGLFCSTCHGSPHAIYPSENPRDNLQNIALQGYAGTLKACEVCHGYTPAAPGPHGYNQLGIEPVTGNIPHFPKLLPNFPNPASYMTKVPYLVSTAGMVKITVYNLKGEIVRNHMNQFLQPGEYVTDLYTYNLPSGTYLCILETTGGNDALKILVTR